MQLKKIIRIFVTKNNNKTSSVGIVKIEAYHGTSKENAEKILKESYKSSDWIGNYLGRGIYFFIEIFAYNNAYEWAKKNIEPEKIVVLQSNIKLKPEELFDLTDEHDKQIYRRTLNNIKDFALMLRNLKIENIKNVSGVIIDEVIIPNMKEEIKAVKSDTSTRFAGYERFYSAVPNATELCVKDKQIIIKTKIANNEKRL